MNKAEKAERAFLLYEEIKDIGRKQTSRLLDLGRMFMLIRDRKLYKDLGCETFTEFCADPDIGYQKSTIYGFIKIHKKYRLEHNISDDILLELKHGRLQLLLSLIDDDPEGWIDKGLTWSYADLINAVRKAKGRDSMPKTSFQKGEIPNNYIKYVESCPCLLHPARKSEKAHFPRTHRMGGELVIPLCRECHAELHTSAREGGIATFFANNFVKIGQWLEQMIKDLCNVTR